jgi:putative endopeptidase
MYELAGWKDGATVAKSILNLETSLARVQWSNVESRDAIKVYNPKTPDELKKLTPNFDWMAFFSEAEVPAQPTYILTQPSYFAGLDKQLVATPLPLWKDYFRWHLLSTSAPYLPKAFVDENFAFFGTVLNGQKENRPRWKRGVATVENALGEVLGRIYVSKYFPPDAKTRMDALVGNLLKAYEESFKTNDWMDDATKAKAQEKIATFNPKIGYPVKWKDYSKLTIAADDLFGNLRRSMEVEYQRQIKKLGSPIDRDEWYMTPQTVNAYYNPELNEIVFPAAILQPPFFNKDADDAVNYGAIGAVIGHEIGHGFDDQGSRYDAKGALNDWWTKETRSKFDAKAKALIDQYNMYEPLPGQKVNGAFTIGENLADLGGLSIAYNAYKISLGGKEAPVIDGLSGDQRFFMGWAQIWARKYRDENLLNRLKTDPHSPSEFRCNGVVVNMPAFMTAYGVKEGDKLYRPPEKQIRVW